MVCKLHPSLVTWVWAACGKTVLAMPCWWVLTRTKQLPIMAATAGVIWLCVWYNGRKIFITISRQLNSNSICKTGYEQVIRNSIDRNQSTQPTQPNASSYGFLGRDGTSDCELTTFASVSSNSIALVMCLFSYKSCEFDPIPGQFLCFFSSSNSYKDCSRRDFFET